MPFIWWALMRQRLQGYLPVFLIALVVQILAPIGASWAAAVTASDPLRSVEICRGSSAGQPAPEDDFPGRGAHDSCALCCVAQTGTGFATPQPVLIGAPLPQAMAVIWHTDRFILIPTRDGSHAQARAPPAGL